MLLKSADPENTLNAAEMAEVKSNWRRMVFAANFSHEDKKYVMKNLAAGVRKDESKSSMGKRLTGAASASLPNTRKAPACLIEFWKKQAGRFPEITQTTSESDPTTPGSEPTTSGSRPRVIGSKPRAWDDSKRCEQCQKSGNICIKVVNVATSEGDHVMLTKRQVAKSSI